MQYNFPVTNKFEARAVTELNFEIDHRVYIDLDAVRGKDYLDQIKFNLNIDENRLREPTDTFTKIIFSGHRGTGKSLELKRFKAMSIILNAIFLFLLRLKKNLKLAVSKLKIFSLS